MFKQHRKLFLSFFMMAVITGFIMLFSSLGATRVVVGKTITSQQRPQQWKKIMADNINAKGINIIIDGKKTAITGASVIVSDRMDILIPVDIATYVLNCSYAEYEDGHIRLQKADTVVEAYIDKDYIIVDGVKLEMSTPCMKIDSTMYIRANIFNKGFGYEMMWNIDENTLHLTDINYLENYLPSRFSYVDIGRVPQIKNQGDLSICWATASVTAIESCLMPKENLLLSASHMAYSNGNASTIYVGGEYTRSLAYLTSWMGPVRNEDAFVGGKYNPDATPVKHVQEAQLIESKNYQSIKKAVFLYGGVQTSMYTSMSTAYSSSVYYNKKNAAYCYIGTQKANHAVTIIGWDDNYPKENFNMNLEGNGAFICMNSWGTQFGQNGIFYVSYYDSNIGKNNVVYTKIEETDNYNNIYQTDLSGWVGQLGYESESAFFANCYTPKANEVLKAAGFYATGRNTEYELYFVKNFKDTYSFNEKTLVTKGKFINAGYYTVEFPEGIDVQKGEKYAIIVKIKTPNNPYPIAVEHRAGASTQNVVVEDGEGYISLLGSYSWERVETSKNCNVCLKVYTDNAE